MNTVMLDILERAIRASIEVSEPPIHEITVGRGRDGRLDIRRRWQGWLRWVYVTASNDPGLPRPDLYLLFLGWYSDPPGETFWEGRKLGALARAHELVSLWVLQGAPPETL